MKKSLCLVLSLLLLLVFSYAPLVAADGALTKSKQALLVTEVKAGVAHLGKGKRAVVRVVLHDKTKYHGYITEIGEDSFTIADARTGATAPIAYREVKGIKGNNFSSGAKIGIGIGIAAAIAVIIAVLAKDDEVEGGGRDCTRTAPVTSPCPPGCVCIQ